jgi:hypothetical protein
MVALACTAALAAEIDLSDFDDDLMRSMDDSIKDLEPVIAAGNVHSAVDDAAVIVDGLKWTQDYFVKKGNTDDAVKFAHDSLQRVDAVQKALVANDLQTAAAAARVLSKSCKACHDVYKPLTK